VVEDDSSAHFIPIGRLSHEAANEIAALRAENERLRKREATLFEMVKRCERDAQRTLRDANNQGHVCGYRTACEAIQQRAAGLGEPKEE
jgi:N-acetylmuramic acid 6-phosphate (MurNAc-6-P) etherase